MTDNKKNPSVEFERINILYDNTKYGYLGIAGAITFFAYIAWDISNPRITLIWVTAVFISYIPRMILSYMFIARSKNGHIDESNIGAWEHYFFIHSILPFMCFSSAVFIPFGEEVFSGVLFYTAIAMTLLAGAVLSYSTSLPILLLFMNASLIPIIIKCLWMQDPLFNVLAVSMIFAYGLLFSLIPKQHRILLENISLKIESQQQSVTDPLTKLGNRRRLELRIKDIVATSLRRKEPFTVILLDVDHFKEFNDTHGHAGGDDLLVELSEILMDFSRDQDLVIRYGGEEFLLVLPGTSSAQSAVLVERILKRIREHTGVTISAGVATYTEGIEFDQLVRNADEALYQAKENGRNRYVISTNTEQSEPE